jgi:hypothetical protein
MASTTQDELDETFLTVTGQQTSAIGDTTTMLAGVIAQVDGLLSSLPAPVTATTTQSTASTDSGSTAESVVSTVLKSGLGLAPLISGLVGLFSGGDSSTPPALVKYAAPPKVDFEAAESGGQVSGVDYDQTGMPRNYSETALSTSADGSGQTSSPAVDQTENQSSYAPAAASGGTSTSAGSAAPQITVNVQAMDARSFLDRSSDIAAAVREAMLNMNSINDVVNDL